MTELVLEKASIVDLEPHHMEVEIMAENHMREFGIEINTHSEWVDLCCIVENHIRRERGLI